jgi:hypothetical protein
MFASLFQERIVALALLVFLAALPGSAQTSFGRISGEVTDPGGAVIPNVPVVIKNIDTQATRMVNTNESGFYSATELPIGTYSVSVEQAGFRRQERTDLKLSADSRLTVNFSLQIGDVTQAIDVVAQAGEAINTTSGELARTIETKQVTNLALNGRNYTQLLSLVPGAAVTSPDQFAVTTSLSATSQTINGNRADTNNLTVDGAFNLVAGSNGSLMNNVSAEFINEVKVQTSNFSAEYGRTSGPAFNIVTKNGTNEFHGSAFEFFRNNDLDARNFFAARKTKLRFNDFGYALGGPIQKNKLFFFVGEEWKRLRQEANPMRLTVPSNALLNGNFAGQPQLFFPGTKTPIPGNNISNLITPDGRAIGNVYRTMQGQAQSFTDAAVGNNITYAPNNPLDFREDIVRLDYSINEKNVLYGRWIQDYNQLIDPFGTFSATNILPTTPTLRMRPGESFLVAETWSPTPHIVNEAKANASWASQHIPPSGNLWQRAQYGFQFQQLFSGGQYDNGIPRIQITNYAGTQGPTFALMSPSTDIQFSDTVSVTLGNHLLKAGAVMIRDRVDQNGRPEYAGNIVFQASGNTTGNALADALLGNFFSYSEASSDPVGFFRFTQPEFFVQDNWKVNSKLSLEIGIRYQYMQPMYTTANNMANFDQTRFNPAQAVRLTPAGTIVPNSGNIYNGLIRAGDGIPSDQIGRVPGANSPIFQQIPAGAPRGFYDSTGLWGPRFGFAYSPDTKLAIRGGYGIFYDRPEGNVTFGQVNVPPILSTTQYNNGNLANITGGAPGAGVLGAISALNPNIKNAYTQQFSFSMSRELPKGILGEISYVGNVARHLKRQPNINYPDLPSVAASPASTSTNFFNPYPGYGAINQYQSDSTSNYNALQVYAAKRVGAILTTTGYTWSKALGDASAQGDNLEDWQNRHFNYGPTTFDRRHIFYATFVWQLPMLRQYNGIVRNTIGGWQISGVIRAQSGQYYSITGNTRVNARRADWVGGPITVPNPGPNRWFNTAAFASAPDGRFGNSGTGIVEGPGLQSYDLSLAKHFTFGERFDLKFQGDFFNAPNIANFSVSTQNTVVTNTASFGTLSSAYPPRNVQLSLKLAF